MGADIVNFFEYFWKIGFKKLVVGVWGEETLPRLEKVQTSFYVVNENHPYTEREHR